MKESLKLRVNEKYAGSLFQPNEGRLLGSSIRAIEIARDDPRYSKIELIRNEVQRRHNELFFFGWEFKRVYTKKELNDAIVLHAKILTTFEPAGEECGTHYDESAACQICGTHRRQMGPLRLKKSSIPKKDIARTIAGEVVVSKAFKEACESHNLNGSSFSQVYSGKSAIDFFQLTSSAPQLELTDKTIAGINPFDLSESCQGEVYKCPEGHTIGLNLLSELYVKSIPQIEVYDFFETEQAVGVRRGLLRPTPIQLCSQKFRQMVLSEKLKGFGFEVAHIE